MAGGNAHRRRAKRHGGKRCLSGDCLYCKHRPKPLHLFKNKTGHRHNPAK